MDVQVLLDLHKPNPRQGPGSEAHTRLALEMSGLLERTNLRVADVGCGTGAATMVLAEKLDAQITAVDLFPEFLEELTIRAEGRGVARRISTLAVSMAELPFEAASLDAIWSEGAIYNLGFEAGVVAWRRFLKPGGVLAVSELTWLTAQRPAELQTFWDEAYPEADVASAKIGVLEKHGFTPLGYFALPVSCWMDNYYDPLRARFATLLREHDHSEAARALVASDEREIDLYARHKQHVSYGFYIAKKI